MRNRIVSFLGVCTILLFQCNSQNNVRHIILKNGLRVYLVQRDSPVTSAIFQVQGGKMTGPPQLASLTNRMLLQGNQIRNGYQIFREIETLGGRLGADESITTSFAYVTSPSVTFGDCFQIFCECLTMPTFDNSQAAITEFKKLKNQAIHFLFPSKSYKKDDDLLRNMLYDGSPIGKKAEDAGSVFSQDEMIAFYQEHYLPQNSVLVISGDFDESEILNNIHQYWKIHRKKNKPHQIYIEQGSVAQNSVIKKEHDSKLDHIVIGFRAPMPFDSLFYETCLLRRAVGSGTNSLLYQWMNHDAKFEYQPEAYFIYEYGYGYFSIHLEVPKGKAGYFKKSVLEYLEMIRDEGIPLKSFHIAKRKLISDLAYIDQYTLKTAFIFSLEVLQNQQSKKYYPHFDKIKTLSPEDVNKAARQIFTQPVVVLYTND